MERDGITYDINFKERTEAMSNAQNFIKTKSYPLHTKVTRVIDGGEPVEFKSLFRQWKDENVTDISDFSSLPTINAHKISIIQQSKFDAESLHHHPEMVSFL